MLRYQSADPPQNRPRLCFARLLVCHFLIPRALKATPSQYPRPDRRRRPRVSPTNPNPALAWLESASPEQRMTLFRLLEQACLRVAEKENEKQNLGGEAAQRDGDQAASTKRMEEAHSDGNACGMFPREEFYPDF